MIDIHSQRMRVRKYKPGIITVTNSWAGSRTRRLRLQAPGSDEPSLRLMMFDPDLVPAVVPVPTKVVVRCSDSGRVGEALIEVGPPTR